MMYLLPLHEVILEAISTVSDTNNLVLKLHYKPVAMLLNFQYLCCISYKIHLHGRIRLTGQKRQ